MMRPWIWQATGLLALAGVLGGCDDYLSGPELTEDPNIPPAATVNQLYHGVQLTQFVQHTGDLARHTAIWMQQMAGIGNQTTGRGLYIMGEQDLSGTFSGIYLGGGLLDIRRIQERSEEAGDRVYAGIAKVWEGYLMGESASLWGAIPYSEAVSDAATPALDAQEEVYARVQTVLDAAIADLQSGQGAGPGAIDRVYGGNAARWVEVAHTLKARFYLHWIEAQTTASTQALAQTACGGDCVAKARDAARNGISAAANDFRSFQANAPNQENLWYQFIFVQRQGQLAAGKFLVDLLKSRDDPRLTQYFRPPADGSEIQGAAPGSNAPDTRLSVTRGAPEFRQPMVTYQENQLILAEAEYRLGNEGTALAHLNDARAAATLPALSGLGGTQLLREIMTEKYIALFQNIEVWNDYKRTCMPQLTPAGGASEVIARILYGSAERNTNPNIPSVTEQQQRPRNANDPNPCPAP